MNLRGSNVFIMLFFNVPQGLASPVGPRKNEDIPKWTYLRVNKKNVKEKGLFWGSTPPILFVSNTRGSYGVILLLPSLICPYHQHSSYFILIEICKLIFLYLSRLQNSSWNIQTLIRTSPSRSFKKNLKKSFRRLLLAVLEILLMEELRRSPVVVGSLSHYLQVFKNIQTVVDWDFSH